MVTTPQNKLRKKELVVQFFGKVLIALLGTVLAILLPESTSHAQASTATSRHPMEIVLSDSGWGP